MMNEQSVKSKKGFWSTIVSLLCSAFLVIVVLVAILSRTGSIGLRVIQSGSMTPQLPVGSLIVTKRVLPGEIKPGDVISFAAGSDATVSHRVTQVKKSGTEVSFQTKGDHNQQVDSMLVPAKNLLGKMIFHLPFVGYLLNFLHHPASLIVIICALVFFWILIKMVKLGRNMKSEEQDI